MYSNLESKLKKLAIAFFLLGTIYFVIFGFSILHVSKFLALICILLGPISCWIASWITYAIGEILSNQNHIMYLLNFNHSYEKPKNIHEPEGWLCECGYHNPLNLERCNSCDAPRADLIDRKSKLRNNDDRLR